MPTVSGGNTAGMPGLHFLALIKPIAADVNFGHAFFAVSGSSRMIGVGTG